MKKHGIFSRLMALLLAVALILPSMPMSIFAENGDLATGDEIGDTGLSENIDTSDTISWPIKIYDYLNDGMLFEYSSATHTNATVADGGAYGGGTIMPLHEIGNDYTYYDPSATDAYEEYAYTYWLGKSQFTTGDSSKGGLTKIGGLKYLHLALSAADDDNDTAPLVISDFYSDNTTSGYSPQKVRYAVIVYRTNVANAKINLGWCTDEDNKLTYKLSDETTPVPKNWPYDHMNYDYRGSVSVAADGEWHSIVIDMNDDAATGDLKGMWDDISNVYTVLMDVVGMGSTDDYFDVSHVAYYDTMDEALIYAADAVNFVNDYGEYLLDQTVGTISAPSHTNNALDFVDGAGYNDVDVYGAWGSSASRGSNYVNLSTSVKTNATNYSGGNNSAYFWNGATIDQASVRYITIIYRTHSMPSNAQIGYWIEGSGTASAAGAGSGRNWTKMLTLPQSETKWVAFTYDLTWIGINDEDISKVTTVSKIGAFLPTSGSLDIAYIDYHSSLDAAHAFAEDATNYMNNNTSSAGAPSTTYDLTADFDSNTYDQMGWPSEGMDVTPITSTDQDYLNLSDDTDKSRDLVTFYTSDGTQKVSDVRYVTIVYRTHNLTSSNISYRIYTTSSNYSSGYTWVNSGTGGPYYSSTEKTLPASENEWKYFTYDLDLLKADGDYNANNKIHRIQCYLPGFTDATQSMDIAYIDYHKTSGEATTFGTAAAAYMNSNSGSLTTKHWNMGGNSAFTMLYPSGGGDWSNDGVRGGSSSLPGGYFSYQIGKTVTGGTSNFNFNADRDTAAKMGYTVSDSIAFLYNTSDFDVSKVTEEDETIDLGYTLHETLTDGLMTVGLLESSLITVTDKAGNSYKTIQYKNDTIDYIAALLESTLAIPETDSVGNYNYTFVKGTASELYAYTWNGSSVEKGSQAVDLATALRTRLGITFTEGKDKGSTSAKRGTAAELDATKRGNLIGSFKDCVQYIDSFAAAAYYLLQNLFVDNSYNQVQDEYKYLVLSNAKIDDGNSSTEDRSAYVFDAGFTTGEASKTDNTSDYLSTSTSAVNYNTADGTISLTASSSKDLIYYSGTELTTRYPFLPVTGATGEFAGETTTYFAEHGARSTELEGTVYANRNFNYVMAANGEFIYHEEDNQFFQFEGDDDVYLFINGELVVDIGAAHSITAVEMEVNDYVDWAKKVLASPSSYTAAEVARAEKLNLVEGGVYSFDFYYMERHGWGANCRIATNIRVTDPEMTVNKTAEQYGEDISYGGEVDKNGAIAYNFTLTNTGNTKLYNLTFQDNVIGVNLDYTNGLTVDSKTNGTSVMDASGGTLDAEDLSAYVTGYQYVQTGGTHNKTDAGEYVPAEDSNGAYMFNDSTITFSSNQALIDFLASLAGEGLVVDDTKEKEPQDGSGLWVDGSVTISGIYYKLTAEQVTDGVLNNTVYVTATTNPSPTAEGSSVQRGQALHRVYVSSSNTYYQWAGHDLYLSTKKLLEDATTAAQNEGNQLYEFKTFFDYVNNDTDKITTEINVISAEGDTDPNEKSVTGGYTINYATSGIYTFHVSMSLKDSSGINTNEVKTSASVPVTVYVADVEDSYFVLDYGLTTQSLDTYGELFKNDNLLGGSGDNSAALMGLGNTEPSYLAYKANATTYNRISFSAADLSASKDVKPSAQNNTANSEDGVFTLNMSIPTSGKTITYNANTETYSLTEAGTVTVHVADVPSTWNQVYLYYWYDSNTSNTQVPTWPGTAMVKNENGTYSLDIPDNVTHIILNNDSQQTADITLTPGVETTFTINDDCSYTKSTVVKNVSIHADVPSDWGSAVYLHYQEENSSTWVAKKMDTDSTVSGSGAYSVIVPGNVNKAYVSDAETDAASTKKTHTLTIFASRETWINVNQTAYTFSAEYTAEPITITASNVPANWTDVKLYCWNGDDNNDWPGKAMTKKSDGSYSLEIAGHYNYVIISGVVEGTEGRIQTVDLPIRAGWDAAIAFSTDTTDGKYTAVVTPESGSSTTINATVPSTMGTPNLVSYDSAGAIVGSPVAMTAKADGSYSYTINDASVANIVIQDSANSKGTSQIAVYGTKVDLAVSALYSALASYSDDSRTIHAKVPAEWTSVSLYCWDDSGAYYKVWPGETMTAESGGWFSADVPSDISNVIISGMVGDSRHQTVDLSVQSGLEAWISLTNTNADGQYHASINEAGFTFTPKDFMDDLYSVWMAATVHKVGTRPTALNSEININNEVQMYKKVTVLPATVVYYEDYFPALQYVSYSDSSSESVQPTFEPLNTSGEPDDAPSQSVDQNEEYGHDDAYSSNSDMSGGSVTTVKISEKRPGVKFTFTGTGFEMISRTNAYDSGILQVFVFNGDVDVKFEWNKNFGAWQLKDENGNTAAQQFPVITEFDNGGNGGSESIYQVPVIRVDGLTKGTYTVVIAGVPTYHFAENSQKMVTTYLYVDGLRIFNPIGLENDHYNANENGAAFTEIRDLILDGTMGMVSLDGDSTTISTALHTWTENRLGATFDDLDTKWEGNEVNSINDYLIHGPNNEVYMDGAFSTNALALYVKDSGSGAHNLQIAVHALDSGLFNGAASTGMGARLQYGVTDSSTDTGYAWKDLTAITSGTEQYYTIPYSECPVVDGYYQVVLRVVSLKIITTVDGVEKTSTIPAMVSFTSLKTNGLEIKSIGGDAATLRYTANGTLEKLVDKDNDVWEPIIDQPETGSDAQTAAAYPAFLPLSLQMRSTAMASSGNISEPEATEPEVTEPEATEPEATEPEATKPEATEPEATEPKDSEPKETEPKETEPKETEPKETEPKETEPKATEPKATEPKATEPKETEPKATEPKATEPKETEPEVTEPQGTEPDEAEPREIEPTEPDDGNDGGIFGWLINIINMLIELIRRLFP